MICESLAHFLNETTTRHLLETDGATWRFRHRILPEFFAAPWKELQQHWELQRKRLSFQMNKNQPMTTIQLQISDDYLVRT